MLNRQTGELSIDCAKRTQLIPLILSRSIRKIRTTLLLVYQLAFYELFQSGMTRINVLNKENLKHREINWLEK